MCFLWLAKTSPPGLWPTKCVPWIELKLKYSLLITQGLQEKVLPRNLPHFFSHCLALLPLYFSSEDCSIFHICHYMDDCAPGQCIGFNYWKFTVKKKPQNSVQDIKIISFWTNIGKCLSQSDFSLLSVNIQRKPSVTNQIKSNFMENSLKRKRNTILFSFASSKSTLSTHAFSKSFIQPCG